MITSCHVNFIPSPFIYVKELRVLVKGLIEPVSVRRNNSSSVLLCFFSVMICCVCIFFLLKVIRFEPICKPQSPPRRQILSRLHAAFL